MIFAGLVPFEAELVAIAREGLNFEDAMRFWWSVRAGLKS